MQLPDVPYYMWIGGYRGLSELLVLNGMEEMPPISTLKLVYKETGTSFLSHVNISSINSTIIHSKLLNGMCLVPASN